MYSSADANITASFNGIINANSSNESALVCVGDCLSSQES